MHEFELIDRFFRRADSPPVALGIGDDGAILDLPAGRQLVAVVDTLVEDVHFPRHMAATDVGYRSVAVNLSDIAAMGATPAWMTLALTLPHVDEDWLNGFAEGLFTAADEYAVALVGGDTTSGQQVVVSVQLLGHVAANRWLTRSGCKPGDVIYVSGTPGDAAAGLERVRQGDNKLYLARRFLRPEARVSLGGALAGLASAAIDVSDGLCADLERLLLASACGATLDQERVPLSPALLEAYGKDQALRYALTGGDDYELLFAVSRKNEAACLAAASDCGIVVTPIGVAEAAKGLRITAGGEPVEIDTSGYRHFD